MVQREVVLITGASVGLGLAIAKRLIKIDKYHLVLTARASSMNRFAECNIGDGQTCWIRPLDVTDADQRTELVDEINAKLGCVYVLINNAGVAYRSCVEHVTEPERLHQMNINFRSPIELSRAVLPGMRAKRRGKIINISSVGGMMAMPTMSVYSASKFALEGASEALYYEVRPWNVHVTLIQPGFMRSEAFAKVPYTLASKKSSQDPADPYHQHYVEMKDFVAKNMGRALATSDSVAAKVVKVIEARNPPLRVYGSADAIAFALLRRFLPRRFYNWLLYRNLPNIASWGSRVDP